MGTTPLRSPKHWGTVVHRWRKKEAGIALGRFLLGFDAGYKQWDCFLFSDYMNRCKLGRTFDVRHLPLSDGRDDLNFSGQFKFDWSKHAWTPSRSRSKASSYVKPEPKCKPPPVDGNDDVPMIFDVELDKLVPL